MAIIPVDEKVFMVDKRTNTIYGGSAALQAMQEWYTMQDIIDTINQSNTVVRWSPEFTATGLAFTGSGVTYPTYNSKYVQAGKLVSFWIEIDLSTVTNFGTGQYKVELPVLPLSGTMNHFPGWIWRDPTIPPDDANHIIVNADHLPNTTVLDLHFLVGAPATPKPIIENKLSQGAMGYNLTTVSKMYINGTYIAE